MSDKITMVAEKREKQGSGASGRLRSTGLLPCIIYGGGKEGEMVQVNEHEFTQLMHHHASESLLVQLDLEGKKREVLVKAVQHHPVTTKILHVDFQEIDMKKKIRYEIPVELTGEASGVTQQGGVQEQLLRMVEIECLPSDMIEFATIDVTPLNIGDRVSVGDLDLDEERYTVLTAPEVAIATVMAPRVQEEVDEGEGEGEAEGEEEQADEKTEE